MPLLDGILKILDEKGPLSISSLCNEANGLLSSGKPSVHPSDVKSVLSRKNELFLFYNGTISIKPEKQPVLLRAYSEQPGRNAYLLKVNFIKGFFTYVEWRDKEFPAIKDIQTKKRPGSVPDFKTSLYRTQIWSWDKNYLKDKGIVLDGNSWSVSLQTKSLTYECSGIGHYPEQWAAFCMAIQKLTGAPFR
ncbi:hypothetical protein BN1002_02359 [Bacillus sp. B-jedd]|nr:hypothetical protein BN1002_02359 [Bacillus sp. B-jedd]